MPYEKEMAPFSCVSVCFADIFHKQRGGNGKGTGGIKESIRP